MLQGFLSDHSPLPPTPPKHVRKRVCLEATSPWRSLALAGNEPNGPHGNGKSSITRNARGRRWHWYIDVSLVESVIKGFKLYVCIARITLSQGHRLRGQPHNIGKVKVGEPNSALVVGAPTLAGTAPGSLSDKKVFHLGKWGPYGQQGVLVSEERCSSGLSVRPQPVSVDCVSMTPLWASGYLSPKSTLNTPG
jgi:hypothetical protein